MKINILILQYSLMKKRQLIHINVKIYLLQYLKLWLLKSLQQHYKYINKYGKNWVNFHILNKLKYQKKFNKLIF